MTRLQVKAYFRDVKRAYFPQWDRENRWRVQFGGPGLCRESTGYCDSGKRTIFLDDQILMMTIHGMRAFLIHEICHDVAAAGHNLTWARRMERAAKRAERRDELEVASVLRSDMYSCCDFSVYRGVTGT